MVVSVLALLLVTALSYLMFVLMRFTGSGWARVALAAGVGTLVAGVFSSLFSVYFSASGFGGFPIPWDFGVLFRAWDTISKLEALGYVIFSVSFLGLAITQRRSKRRVARGGKT